MKLTVGQLKRVIAENLGLLPPRMEIEQALQDSKFDKDAAPKVLSKLDRVLPAGGKVLLQNLSRTLQLWQMGKAGWGQVTSILDKMYAMGEPPRRSSYVSMKAVRPSERPKVA